MTDIARELGFVFEQRAMETTDEDKFVAENFALLKSSGLFEAGVPAELGGGGAGIDELASMLRTLAHHCGSTALAFSMHTHQVAIPAWRWTHQKAAAVEPLLKRIATERIQLVSSGGSDWLNGSGKAEKVDGGYRITARKVFSSGAPTGDLLMTSAVLESEGEPAMVLHFGIPMNSPHVKVLDTWRTLGMRGTGSHDVLIDGHIVPEAAVAARRVAGRVAPAVSNHRDDRLLAGLCRLSRRRRERARYRHWAGETKAGEPSRHRACRTHGHRTDRGPARP